MVNGAGPTQDVIRRVREACGEDGADFVVECAGVAACTRWAYDVLTLGGTLAQVGSPGQGQNLTIDARQHGPCRAESLTESTFPQIDGHLIRQVTYVVRRMLLISTCSQADACEQRESPKVAVCLANSFLN